MKIFVSIVSYRDRLLLRTIKSLLDNKSNEYTIVIGVFEQTAEADSLSTLCPELINDRFIRYKRIDPIYSEGVCWARHINFLQMKDEDFIYEIDSHMMFDKDWDKKLIDDYRQGIQKENTDRIIITGACKSFELDLNDNIVLHTHPVSMQSNVKYFTYQKRNDILGSHSDLHPSDGNITPAIHICAGNFFTHAAWVKNVGANPKLYFDGEEQYMILESFRQGYKMFHMSDVVSYHYNKTNEYETKQWFNPIITVERYSQLVYDGIENFQAYLKGLDENVLKSYYEYSGVNYINQSLDERAKTYGIRIPDDIKDE